jgi:hypothetical protein
MSSRQDDHRTCGPECPYRGLYEGSQASLADMARRQAEALRRVGRLRSALVLTLKRHFPDKFARAESGLGGRLSDADDEILLAYLAAFLGASPLDNQLQSSAGLHALRDALTVKGFRLEGDDPSQWARQILTQVTAAPTVATASAPSNQTAPNPPAAQPNGPSPQTAPISGQNGSTTGAEPARRGNTSDNIPPSLGHLFPQDEPSSGLADLFLDTASNTSATTQVTPTAQEDGGTSSSHAPLLGDLFLPHPPGSHRQDLSGRWSPSPLLPVNPKSDPEPSVRPSVTRDTEQRASRPETTQQGDVGDDDQVMIVTGMSNDADNDTTAAQLKEETAGQDVKPVGSSSEHQLGEMPVDGQGWADPVAPKKSGNVSARGLGGAVPELDSDRPGVTTATTATTSDPGSASAARPSEDTAPPSTTASVGPGYEQPLRPELFTPTRSPKTIRRTARTVRQRADRPDPMLLDIPVEQGPEPELTEDLLKRLADVTMLARPVFTSDLIAVAGSADLVSVWEGQLRADPANSPVRFLAAKGRHRLRGSLVVPVARNSSERAGRPDWWADCVERYRGARLYELGVLLHRIGDEVVSSQFEEHGVLLRLNTSRGIVGVVVLFEAVVGEDSSSQIMERMLTQLLGERCSLVAVLTTSAEASAVSGLGEAIGRLAVSKGWRPQFPVITARSWEFADDRGSTAQLILGG